MDGVMEIGMNRWSAAVKFIVKIMHKRGIFFIDDIKIDKPSLQRRCRRLLRSPKFFPEGFKNVRDSTEHNAVCA